MIDFNNVIDLTDVKASDYKNYIGNGYRNCCYTTDNNRNGVIILFGYDTAGNPKTFTIPHKSHIKYNVKYKTNEKDIFGRYVETRYFDSASKRAKYVESSGSGLSIVECLPPVNEFLHKAFDDVALDETFNLYPLRIHYFDIETEISDEGFESGDTARQRINMITIYDTQTEKYYTWSLNHVVPDFKDEFDENGNLVNECPLKDVSKDRFVIFDFNDNEANMLSHFVDWFENNYPDVLCGFNSQAFDLGYIINRVERVLGDPDKVDNEYKTSTGKRIQPSDVTRRLSPVGKISIRENNTENERANKQAKFLYELDGIFSADVLILYRDKFKINQPLDGGNGLDNIGEAEVGIHKIHYKGSKAPDGSIIHSLKDLYLKDFQRFYKYNVMDVEVLKRVEEKVKTIPLARIITSAGLSNYNAIYSSIGYLIGSLIMFSKTQMGTTFVSYKGADRPKIPYEGAYVFPTKQGYYRDGVIVIDFNSLYPNSIIASNISPETYVGKISRFPIIDPTMEFFAKEPPIDLNGTDTTKVLERTDDETEYNLKFGKKFNDTPDKDLEKFYMLPANGTVQKVITRKQLDELLKTKCIFTRNNTLFLKHSVKQGVVSAWSEHFYKLRKATKKKGQKLALNLHKGIITENIDKVKEQIENLDNTQQARKISLNSIYGILSTPFSCCYNPYISQSITRSGKYCNQSSAAYIRKVFKERYGIDDRYECQLGGDTDSCIFTSIVRISR